MKTETFNTTVEKLMAMAMVWDEEHNTNVESELFMVKEDKNSMATFQHDDSVDVKEFVFFMNEVFNKE